MNTEGAIPPVPWARAVSTFAARAVIVMGGLALTGWALDLPVLRSLGAGLASMKPNTAIAPEASVSTHDSNGR